MKFKSFKLAKILHKFFIYYTIHNLISPKLMEQLLKSNSVKKFKAIASTVHSLPIF